jgi:hypothetical protein
MAGIRKATGAERATIPGGLADPGADGVGLVDDVADGLVDAVAVGARPGAGAVAVDDGDATWGIAVVGAVTGSWWPSRPTAKNPAPMSSSTKAATHQRLGLVLIPAMRVASAGEAGSVIQRQKLHRHPYRGHRPE